MKEDRYVLVVEDDAALQRMISAILRRDGWSFRIASDGLEAIANIERDLPAVILLDLMMPRMNGFEVLEHVRRTSPRLLRRVIVTTAVSEAMLGRLTYAKRIFKIIRKPFDLNESRDCVNRCGQRSSLSDGPDGITRLADAGTGDAEY